MAGVERQRTPGNSASWGLTSFDLSDPPQELGTTESGYSWPGSRPVRLNRIVIRDPRPGWVSLEVPPLESWEEPLRWLTPQQRERIESADFYRLLQEHLTRRYLAMGSGP